MGKKRAPIFYVGGALALLVAAVVAWWTWGEVDKRRQERAIEAAVADATARLRDALAVAPNATSKSALPRLEEHLAALEKHLETARAAAARSPEIADGAEHYLIAAHAIVRRQATSIRQAERSADGRAALVAHMRRAARRDAAWIREAMAQKKALEARYFDYGLTLEALAEMLRTFPDARKRVLPYVGEKAVLEAGPAEEARALVLKESKRVEAELNGVRRLAPR